LVSINELLKHPRLQVALDLTSLEEALRIAKIAWDNGAEILEAGTPLIKSVGLRAVKALRENFPEAIIVADMKTMDTGFLEAKLAHEAGADIMTVLSVASNHTINEALMYGRKHGLIVAVDLISHPNPLARAAELDRMNVDILISHLGIDVQKKLGITVADRSQVVSKIRKVFSKCLAVAGGIKPGKAKILVKSGANIVIVGSAITKSSEPHKVVRELISELKDP